MHFNDIINVEKFNYSQSDND
uniref:Uncharacterized protein n=1 Tax=Tetranychus urticae TaxID=32264 RepID=T1KTB2_TETUR